MPLPTRACSRSPSPGGSADTSVESARSRGLRRGGRGGRGDLLGPGPDQCLQLDGRADTRRGAGGHLRRRPRRACRASSPRRASHARLTAAGGMGKWSGRQVRGTRRGASSGPDQRRDGRCHRARARADPDGPSWKIEDTWFVAGMKGIGRRTRSSPTTSSCPSTGVSAAARPSPVTISPSTGMRRSTARHFSCRRLILVGPQLGWAAQPLISSSVRRRRSHLRTPFRLTDGSTAFQLPDRGGRAPDRHRPSARLSGRRRHRRRQPPAVSISDYLTRARVRSDTGHVAGVHHPRHRHSALRAWRRLLRRSESAAADLARLRHRGPPRDRFLRPSATRSTARPCWALMSPSPRWSETRTTRRKELTSDAYRQPRWSRRPRARGVGAEQGIDVATASGGLIRS